MAVVLLLVTGVARAEAAPTLVREKDVNLDEALRLAYRLRAGGYDVVLTRSTDVFVPLVTRARMADGAHIFVSMHNNASRNKAARGTEVYSQLDNALGGELARAVLAASTARAGTIARGALTRRGSHGDDYYSVLRNSRATALIFEGAFISNPTEARWLADPAFRQRLADGVADGIGAVLATKLAPQAAGPPPPRTTPLGPLLLPPAALAAAHTGGGVAAVRWDAVPLATLYEVWRDGVLVARGPGTTFTDAGLGAGVHRYQVRAVTELLRSVVQESAVSTVDVIVPWRVVIDAGHGGKDTGAVGRI
jgi:N-acetylmuramoyl-L-alanine amidase